MVSEIELETGNMFRKKVAFFFPVKKRNFIHLCCNIGQLAEAEVDLDENEGGTLLDLGDMKVGKKKLAKLEAKAERKAAREAELKEREERKAIEIEKEKERKILEELEEKQEKEREEQLKKEAEEKIRKEHEEYLKMKVCPISQDF